MPTRPPQAWRGSELSVAETVLPHIVWTAWHALQNSRKVLSVEELSVHVSTNAVYRLVLERGGPVVAKVSSYGSFVHFRQDHQLVRQWHGLLQNGRFERFLAPVLGRDGQAFTFRGPSGHGGEAWVVFYEEIDAQQALPAKLSVDQIDSLGRELAGFHAECARVAPRLNPTWKSLGSDIANLFDAVGNLSWRAEHHIADSLESPIKAHCQRFLIEAERLGYWKLQRIPVLVDWNAGNFSIREQRTGFTFCSRWDYDWFRIEPRTLDFYFCSRVVRASGDEAAFSYSAQPLFEPRFLRFLKAYHSVFPLEEADLLLLREFYRFFLLNYVVRSGEHFFASSLWPRLISEAVHSQLPALDNYPFEQLLQVLD